MILPPLVIDVRIRDKGEAGRRFRVWLPVVLLWPLLLIVVGFCFLVSVPLDLILFAAGSSYHDFTLLIIGCLKLLAETRGTHVDVHAHDDSLVTVDIF